MFTTLPLFKNPLKNAKNVKQLKHTLMEFDAKYQTKAIGELVKDELAFLHNKVKKFIPGFCYTSVYFSEILPNINRQKLGS